MKKQPAHKSYFFDKGYKDVARVMKNTWSKAFKPVTNEFARLRQVFANSIIAGIFTFLCDVVVFSVITIFILVANLAFFILFVCFFVVIGVLVYFGYSILYVVDGAFCAIKHISSHCPNCQKKFGLPTYKCPKCGALHTSLRPSKYGILKRKCLCGEKLPTTFFNGRQKLEAVCPSCGSRLKDGGRHIEIMIPVVGGPSSGKTCFINMAISQMGRAAKEHNLDFSYSPVGADEYYDNKRLMDAGRLPYKTNDQRLKYYQFYLSSKNEKIKNLISLCDLAGEVYDDTDGMGEQIGYKYANAFLMVVDPLSVAKFRRELEKTTDLKKYYASAKSMDEILSLLISTLENMHCLTSKNMIKTDVVVVFSKCDLPLIEEKIGETAVNRYMQTQYGLSRYDAQNNVCEDFLHAYEEDNFLNGLKSKFKSVQFFTCSALGHVADGRKFQPAGVEEPVLWLIDKVSKSIDLKNKWGKSI